MSTLACPANPTSNYFNYSAMLLGVAAYIYCRLHDIGGADAAMAVTAAYVLPILALETIFLRTPWRDSVGLDFSRRDTNLNRIGIKLVGVYGSLAFVAFLYWLFPEYHGDFYRPFWRALHSLGPVVLVLILPYTVFMDERLKDPYDSYYYFGHCLMMRWDGVSGRMIVQHLLGWVVKGYFLPLMWVSMAGNMNYLNGVDFSDYLHNFRRFYHVSVDILFTVDLLGAVAGYSFALRLFDTHFRSAEPTLFGWIICVICYQPFQSVVMRFYLSYNQDNTWFNWLADWPWMQYAWGCVALAFLVVYTLSSINFGCRFSNLTHRGVLTKGMYRFSKHPAYVCKNTFWWLTFVPFVPVSGWEDSLRYCLLLLGINTVYYLRARTEERHLSRDPNYVAYALYMNEHSVFREVAHYLPFLRYKAPANWEKLPKPYMGIK